MNLSELNLGHNKLTGDIPIGLSQLNSLAWLDVSDNRLTGAIPEELGNLTNLGRLYISQNQFTGCIPGNYRRSRQLPRRFDTVYRPVRQQG